MDADGGAAAVEGSAAGSNVPAAALEVGCVVGAAVLLGGAAGGRSGLAAAVDARVGGSGMATASGGSSSGQMLSRLLAPVGAGPRGGCAAAGVAAVAPACTAGVGSSSGPRSYEEVCASRAQRRSMLLVPVGAGPRGGCAAAGGVAAVAPQLAVAAAAEGMSEVRRRLVLLPVASLQLRRRPPLYAAQAWVLPVLLLLPVEQAAVLPQQRQGAERRGSCLL